MRTFNVLAAVAFAAILLSACQTTAGAGKDISKAGSAITKSADKHSY